MSNENVPLSLLMHYCRKNFKFIIKDKCSSIGLNSTYSDIIMLLGRNNEGFSQNEIAEVLHLAKPTISLTLKNMEKDDIIVKTVDELDSRKTIVKLTSNGLNIDKQIRQFFKETEEQMTKDIEEEEVKSFMDLLYKMINNLEIK